MYTAKHDHCLSNHFELPVLKKPDRLSGLVISDYLEARIYCECPIKNIFTPCWRMSDKASADVLLRFPSEEQSTLQRGRPGCLVSTSAAALCGSP